MKIGKGRGAIATTRKKEYAPAELSALFANLKLVYHSGLPLSEGFEILQVNARNAEQRQEMAALKESADMGISLHEGLTQNGRIPSYALSLIRIGEETGRMEDTLESLRIYYEKRDALNQSIRSSIVYPLSMMGMVFLVVLILLTQAMPVFEQVFQQLGLQMTGLALGLLNIGNALSRYALWIGAVILALCLIVLLLRATVGGRKLLRTIFDNSIFTKELSLRLSVQRFALAMSTMLSCGIDSDVALQMARPLMDSPRAADKLGVIQKAMANGDSFQDALQASGLFPEGSMALLAMGIRTGTDAEAMDQIGQNITVSTERQLERLVAAIEPTMVCIMCVLVGMVLLSVMLPLMGVLTNI